MCGSGESTLEEGTKLDYTLRCSPCDFYSLPGVQNYVRGRCLRLQGYFCSFSSRSPDIKPGMWGTFCLPSSRYALVA